MTELASWELQRVGIGTRAGGGQHRTRAKLTGREEKGLSEEQHITTTAAASSELEGG